MNNYILYSSIFFAGTLFGIILMSFSIKSKNKYISSYKRELEKESIESSENSAKVKVLEQKIAVLEKALDNTLKNKE